MKTVDNVWDELTKYWREFEPNFNDCIGATNEAISSLEDEINISLPITLKQSLRRCNNYPVDFSQVKKSSSLFLGEAGLLCNTEKMIEWQKEKLAFSCSFPFEKVYGDIVSPPKGWSKDWIPIYYYNANIFLCIDRREVNGIAQEKILYLDEEYDILALVADSYLEFLNMILESILETGLYASEALEKIMLDYGVISEE
jgi:cell wall assembly regulator SMI1